MAVFSKPSLPCALRGIKERTPHFSGGQTSLLVRLPESTKKVKKMLDKLQILWYNQDVNEGSKAKPESPKR